MGVMGRIWANFFYFIYIYFIYYLFGCLFTHRNTTDSQAPPPHPPGFKILFFVKDVILAILIISKQKLELQRKHEIIVWRIEKIIKCITRVTVIVDILITRNVCLCLQCAHV